MEYYENGGDAVAKLNWSLVSEIVDPGTFTGEYFSNQTLTGTPAVTRQDSSIAFNWGEGSPHASIPVDHFSVRWSRTTSFLSGTYAFTVRADDGVRLKIDGQVVLDKWIDQSPTTYVVSVPLTAGNHSIILEYYENGGGAVANLSWELVTPLGDTDFVGQYFNTMTLTGPSLSRTDPSINFAWGTASPLAGIQADNFSVRWTATKTFLSGIYHFSVTADDGVRLKIDGQTVIDKWQDQSGKTYATDVALSSGQHTIVMEYYDNFVDATAKLSWTAL
jgi:RNase P/RNase MRP subunit p29